MARKPSEETVADFIGRMRFLQTMWGCRTSYDVDLETGIGWLEIHMPGTGAVLRINKFHVSDVFVPEEPAARPAAQ